MKALLVFGLLLVGWVADVAAAPPWQRLVDKPVSSRLHRLAVFDIELSGDPGGPELAEEHAKRLKMASAKLRDELERSGLFQVVNNAPAQQLIDRLKSQQLYWHDCNGCDLEVGRRRGADQILVSWVNRVSGLILTLTYEIHDVRTGQIAARKSYDFRGDNDTAWTRVIVYMVRDMKEQAKSNCVKSEAPVISPGPRRPSRRSLLGKIKAFFTLDTREIKKDVIENVPICLKVTGRKTSTG